MIWIDCLCSVSDASERSPYLIRTSVRSKWRYLLLSATGLCNPLVYGVELSAYEP